MRKIPLLLIPLLFTVFMLSAQQKQLLQRYPDSTVLRERQAFISGQKTVISQVAHRDKSVVQSQAIKNDNVLVKENKGSSTSAKVPVTITCIVSPELVKMISNSGGEIVSSSKEENVIIANVPADAIKKISVLPDVKEITPVTLQPVKSPTAKSRILNSEGPSGVSPAKNLISESVLKSRKQGTTLPTAATN